MNQPADPPITPPVLTEFPTPRIHVPLGTWRGTLPLVTGAFR